LVDADTCTELAEAETNTEHFINISHFLNSHSNAVKARMKIHINRFYLSPVSKMFEQSNDFPFTLC